MLTRWSKQRTEVVLETEFDSCFADNATSLTVKMESSARQQNQRMANRPATPLNRAAIFEPQRIKSTKPVSAIELE